MSLHERLRKTYWGLLRCVHRRLHPQAVILSPHRAVDGILRHLPPDRFTPDRPMVMIDGGAHDGRTSLMFARQYPNFVTHTFEANADLEPGLETALAHLPGTRNVNALARCSGKLSFQVNQSPMTSSVLPVDHWSTEYFGDVTQPAERRTVDALSLDDWADAHSVNRVDMIKLDLQGYEHEALLGARRLLDRGVGCIYTEVNFISFYQGCALFADVDMILRQHGYRLYNIYHLATHLCDGQIGSADALFIRDITTRPSSVVIEQPHPQPRQRVAA